jgi:hypothetical protein
MTTFKTYIEKIASKKIPKEIMAKFGKILFGEIRDMGNIESDTEYETYVTKILNNWARGLYMKGRKEQDNELIKTIEELRKLVDYYPDVLKPNATLLYRSLYLNLREFKDTFNLTRKDFVKTSLAEPLGNKKHGQLYVSSRTIEYTPTTRIQSWTIDLHTAMNFLRDIKHPLPGDPQYFKIDIMMKCKFPENELLFRSDFFKHFIPPFPFSPVQSGTQKEILHIGTEPLNVTIFTNERSLKIISSREEITRKKKMIPSPRRSEVRVISRGRS